MRRKALLSGGARAYLRREISYLGPRSPGAARRLVERIEAARERLVIFPLSGPPGIVPGTRRVVVGDYVLTYTVKSAVVEIVSIRHGRQLDPAERPNHMREGDPET